MEGCGVKNIKDRYWRKSVNTAGSRHQGVKRGQVKIGIILTEEMFGAIKDRALAEQRSVAGMVREFCLAGLTPVTTGCQASPDQSQTRYGGA
jgi:hypothetical protein